MWSGILRIQSSDSFKMMNRPRINPEVIVECREQAMRINVLRLLLKHVVQYLLDGLELPKVVVGLRCCKRCTRP